MPDIDWHQKDVKRARRIRIFGLAFICLALLFSAYAYSTNWIGALPFAGSPAQLEGIYMMSALFFVMGIYSFFRGRHCV